MFDAEKFLKTVSWLKYKENVYLNPNISSGQKIFRYTNLSNLLLLLGAGKNYISKRNKFSDKREKGELLNKKLRFGRFYIANETPPQILLDEWFSKDEQVNEGFHLYASCWTCKEQEDILMWRMYAADEYGVRIGTTVGTMIEAIRDQSYTLLAGRMDYGPEKSLNEVDVALFHKTKFYQNEEEFRFYLVDGRAKEDRRDSMMLNVDPQIMIESVTLSPFMNPDIAGFIKDMLCYIFGFLQNKVVTSEILEYRK